MNNAAGWALALGMVLAPVAASGAAQAEGPYPAWWAPELGLESLDEIDAKLAEPFPEGQSIASSSRTSPRAGRVSARPIWTPSLVVVSSRSKQLGVRGTLWSVPSLTTDFQFGRISGRATNRAGYKCFSSASPRLREVHFSTAATRSYTEHSAKHLVIHTTSWLSSYDGVFSWMTSFPFPSTTWLGRRARLNVTRMSALWLSACTTTRPRR